MLHCELLYMMCCGRGVIYPPAYCMQARQQKLAELEAKAREQQQQQQQEQDAAGQAAVAAAAGDAGEPAGSVGAWIAAGDVSPTAAAAAGPDSGSSSALLAPEASDSSIASIDGQPLKVVVHSAACSSADATAAAAGSSSTPAAALLPPAAAPSPPGSGSLSSITTDEDTCGICFDNNNHVAVKYCGHRLCVDCYRKVWELSGGDSTCPFCRARLEGYMYLDWPLE